jgi:hypothetical protein
MNFIIHTFRSGLNFHLTEKQEMYAVALPSMVIEKSVCKKIKPFAEAMNLANGFNEQKKMKWKYISGRRIMLLRCESEE